MSDPPPRVPKEEEPTANPYGSATHTFRDHLETIQSSFHWYSEESSKQVEVLRRELGEPDEPSLIDEIAAGVLETALGAGAAAAGKFLTHLVAHGTGEVAQEFIKNLFKHGFEEGIAAGRSLLRTTTTKGTMHAFLDAQSATVSRKYNEDEQHYINVGRHEIATIEQAAAVAGACTRANVELAAQHQHDLTRDAWVTYLAQTRFGARSAHGIVTPDQADVGETSTVMSTQDVRDKANRGLAHDAVPGAAPTFGLYEHNLGVMEIGVTLPDIQNNQMAGEPSIWIAALEGVNGAIREQYENRPLSEARIPRQIVASVKGDRPNFFVNVDENGKMGNYLEGDDASWLRARSLVSDATGDHAENAGTSDLHRMEAGLALLLNDLVPTSVRKGLKR